MCGPQTAARYTKHESPIELISHHKDSTRGHESLLALGRMFCGKREDSALSWGTCLINAHYVIKTNSTEYHRKLEKVAYVNSVVLPCQPR